jgi:hypothetical protein
MHKLHFLNYLWLVLPAVTKIVTILILLGIAFNGGTQVRALLRTAWGYAGILEMPTNLGDTTGNKVISVFRGDAI